MSYEPTTWETGDTITANKLNNMETGIADANDMAPLLVTVTVTEEDGALYHRTNKTFNEIYTAFSAGRTVTFVEVTEDTDSGLTTTNCAIVNMAYIENYSGTDDVYYHVSTYTGDFQPEDDDPDKVLVYIES